MFQERRKLPAFHEKEMEKILEKFDLLEKMNNRELNCSICNVLISKINFGCIYISKDKTIKITCSNPECLEKVSLEIQDVI